jgi:hypothetical protein
VSESSEPAHERRACKGGPWVGVTNQLETDTFTVTSFELLCVSSEKHGFQPAS